MPAIWIWEGHARPVGDGKRYDLNRILLSFDEPPLTNI
jgi:hypothetical protein